MTNNNKNGGKLMPNLDQNSTKALNLTVLQRMDPYIEEILITAAHVTLYDFNVDLNQWSRKDVEGSLFVVKRNTQPRFQFIVMNRRNTENLVENLLGDFEFELQVPYLLYRNPVQEVNGIWFYNARECEDVANLFTRILSAYLKVSPKSKVNKNEYEELEAVPTAAVTERQLELPFTTSSTTDVQNALNLGHHSSNSTTIPVSSRASPSPVLNGLTMQMNSSTPTIPLYDNPDPVNSSNHINNLIKPVPFFTPSSSSSHVIQQPTSSVPIAPLNVQRSHGVPLLQPFPPPTPPSSLTPISISPASYGTLTREKVRDALLLLAQDNQFIDMFHQALLKAHQS